MWDNLRESFPVANGHSGYFPERRLGRWELDVLCFLFGVGLEDVLLFGVLDLDYVLL